MARSRMGLPSWQTSDITEGGPDTIRNSFRCGLAVMVTRS
jgi:hypothetical protein